MTYTVLRLEKVNVYACLIMTDPQPLAIIAVCTLDVIFRNDLATFSAGTSYAQQTCNGREFSRTFLLVFGISRKALHALVRYLTAKISIGTLHFPKTTEMPSVI